MPVNKPDATRTINYLICFSKIFGLGHLDFRRATQARRLKYTVILHVKFQVELKEIFNQRTGIKLLNICKSSNLIMQNMYKFCFKNE